MRTNTLLLILGSQIFLVVALFFIINTPSIFGVIFDLLKGFSSGIFGVLLSKKNIDQLVGNGIKGIEQKLNIKIDKINGDILSTLDHLQCIRGLNKTIHQLKTFHKKSKILSMCEHDLFEQKLRNIGSPIEQNSNEKENDKNMLNYKTMMGKILWEHSTQSLKKLKLINTIIKTKPIEPEPYENFEPDNPISLKPKTKKSTTKKPIISSIVEKTTEALNIEQKIKHLIQNNVLLLIKEHNLMDIEPVEKCLVDLKMYFVLMSMYDKENEQTKFNIQQIDRFTKDFFKPWMNDWSIFQNEISTILSKNTEWLKLDQVKKISSELAKKIEKSDEILFSQINSLVKPFEKWVHQKN